MNLKEELNSSISYLQLNNDLLEKLFSLKINYIKDLWQLTRNDLKRMSITDYEINQIVIKLQLEGIDLNKKIYNKN